MFRAFPASLSPPILPHLSPAPFSLLCLPQPPPPVSASSVSLTLFSLLYSPLVSQPPLASSSSFSLLHHTWSPQPHLVSLGLFRLAQPLQPLFPTASSVPSSFFGFAGPPQPFQFPSAHLDFLSLLILILQPNPFFFLFSFQPDICTPGLCAYPTQLTPELTLLGESSLLPFQKKTTLTL